MISLTKFVSSNGTRRKGLALITVLVLLSLSTILLMALFSSTQTELKSTVAYADGALARQQADQAVNLVIGQIQRATQQDEGVDGREIWSSQPGLVRQYKENGSLLRANKLYSDQEMVVRVTSTAPTAEIQANKKIATDSAPTGWNSEPDSYVDMNEPIIRQTPGQTTKHVLFPILDPRAFSADPLRSVEGFSYSDKAITGDGGQLNGVVLPSGQETEDQQRLPMPVQWLYVLKDGTIGYLNPSKTFVGAGGESATAQNPIVSRVAFWTDDDSSKININTAGEGTFWATPRVYHERDRDWAKIQPMMYEYQRYPGHPATVAMSTVLFPGQNMNPPRSDDAAFTKALGIKEKIYDLMPKLLEGGSKAGSVLVPPGRNFVDTDFANVQTALGERLFATVDEFLLRQNFNAGRREEMTLGDSGLWEGLHRADVIERLRGFLTPHSKAPETNPFGLPKISMWPIHGGGAAYQSVYDKTIAKVASISNKAYYFTRNSSTATNELSSGRNSQLHTYLMALTNNPIPGFGINNNATFAYKYGDNRQQILVEIFDYIRSTNLYDEGLAELTMNTMDPTIQGLPTARVNAYATTGANAGLAAKTFTPLRNSTGSSFPGHGQVTPTVLPKPGGEFYRGMGRFFTISEIGMHFITCAEGTGEPGGKTAIRINPSRKPNGAGTEFVPMPWKGQIDASTNWGDTDFWYSNFPPLDTANANPAGNFYPSKYPSNHKLNVRSTGPPKEIDGNDPTYPGLNPLNWNWTLDKNQPLAAGTKRVQATILLEWFCPAAGWARINPDFMIEIDASELRIDDGSGAGPRRMFPLNEGKGPGVNWIRPFGHFSSGWGVYERGGTTSYRPFLQGRRLPAVNPGASNGYTRGSMPYDGWKVTDNAATVRNDTYVDGRYAPGGSGISPILQGCHRYNLISDFFDIPAGGRINFTGGVVKVKLRANTAAANPPILQEFTFNFDGSMFPTPILATKSEDTTSGQNFDGSWWVKRPVAPPYWWSFHRDGALGRKANGEINDIMMATATANWGGRFRFIGDEIGSYGNTPSTGTYNRGNMVIPDDTLQSLVLRHGDPRLLMGKFKLEGDEFVAHRKYGQENLAHNIVLAHWSDGPGLDKGEDRKNWRLVKDANYQFGYLPDHPYFQATGAGLQRYGDFDRATANQTDGAYINKPDEGNTSSVIGASGEQGVPYFTDPWVNWMGGATYFSPNRQVASPGMLGSLPTGVFDSGTSPVSKKREPWRTLLFRPQSYTPSIGQAAHPGAPLSLKGFGSGIAGINVSGVNPPDYLLMDFFWMPIVEPYAIGEPGATAGKINLNYQMIPFNHIKRATGLHAVLKSELLTTLPHADANKYLSRPTSGLGASNAPTGQEQNWFWQDGNTTGGRKFWHREIDVPATLKYFDERFSSGFAFISPAQICEMHLLPKRVDGSDPLVPATWPTNFSGLANSSGTGAMDKFWKDHAITAENVRERPYTNIYPRLTTRSNTFTVHVRAQTIRKARSTNPETFDSSLDAVTSEYRGSTVIERYLDQNAITSLGTTQSDFAYGNEEVITTKQTMDAYHRFRILSQKRFY